MEKNKSFFDFDGTLIRFNSFPYWILFVMIYSFFSFNFQLANKVFKLLIDRKIKKKINHQEFKKSLLELSISNNCNYRFAKFLSYFYRNELIIKLKKLNEHNHEIVISSAAPEIYLRMSIEIIFPENYHDILIIGSKLSENNLNDNYKELKLHNLIKTKFIGENEILTNVFTDSWDDVALVERCENLYLIAPDKISRQKYLSNTTLANKIRTIN